MLQSLLLDEMKVIITIDDFRLKLKLTTNKTLMLTKKLFFLRYQVLVNHTHEF